MLVEKLTRKMNKPNSMEKITLLIFLVLLASCKFSKSENEGKPFGSEKVECTCLLNNNEVSFFNILPGDQRKIEGENFFKICEPNVLMIKGYIQEDDSVIYYFPPDTKSVTKQKLIRWNARKKDTWYVDFSNRGNYKFTLLNRKYDKNLKDSVQFIKVENIRRPKIQLSNPKVLVYFKISPKYGVVSSYHSADEGYFIYSFYPKCGISALSFQQSLELDSIINNNNDPW